MKPEVVARFKELVDRGVIREALREQSSMNWDLPVVDMGVWWDDVVVHRGWKIEHHILTGHYRIIGPDSIRYAFGIEKYISKRIMGQPINIVVNYLHLPVDAENSFAYYPADGEEKLGSVVLVHGWGCRAIAMEGLAHGLNHLGYDAYCYDYRSSSADIAALADALRRNLLDLAAQKKLAKFHLLTHSMGGLLLRKALEMDTTGELSTLIDRVVMMGPPNRGSLLADLAEGVGVGIFNKSIGDMTYLTDSAVKHIGRPCHYHRKIGIVAGTFDLKVLPRDSVSIPDMTEGVDYEIVRVSASHPGLRSSDEALSNAVFFLQNGKFP